MRTNRRPAVATLALSLVAAALLMGCGGPPELASHWRDREIVVDGKLDDWAGLQSDLDAGGGTSATRLGIANDGEALYLSLATADPDLQRLIAHRGLTIWFDLASRREHVAGVRFPLPARVPSHWGEIGGSRPRGAQLDNLELLGPQPYTRRELAAPGGDGVQVAIGFGERRTSYELRVPLRAAAPAWGLGVAPGALLGVGVQSKGIEPRPAPGGGEAAGQGPGGGAGRPDGGQPPADGEAPGDDDGSDDGPRGGRGGPGGPGGRMRPGATRDYEVWARVRLAAPGDAQPR
jgi:hypothetical protein